MIRTFSAIAALIVTLSPGWAGQPDPAQLRSCVEVTGSVSVGLNFSGLFAPERIPSNPGYEISKLEKKLTGKPADASLNLRIAELHRMLKSAGAETDESGEGNKHYGKAAEQYEVLLKDRPSDVRLLIGYATALQGSSGGSNDLLSFGWQVDNPARDKADQLFRKALSLNPKVWEAYVGLARHTEIRALTGLIASRLAGSPGIDPSVKDKLPEPLTKEQADRLFQKAEELRDMAVKCAPRVPDVYLARHATRMSLALQRYLVPAFLGQEPEQLDPADTAKLVSKLTDPSDLRKAWQLDPLNATVIRSLMFIEIANTLVEESAVRRFDDLTEGIFAKDPSKRTWNTLPQTKRSRLSGYEAGIRKVISKWPGDVWAAYEALGMLKAFQGDEETARQALRTAAKLSGAAYLSYMLLFADAARDGGLDVNDPISLKKVLPIWDMRLKVSNSTLDMMNAATMYANAGRLDAAESLARRIVAASPENAQARLLLGQLILKRQGNIDEAIKQMEMAIPGLKDDERLISAANLDLGIAYAITGKSDKAVEYLSKIGNGNSFLGKAQQVLGLVKQP